ncbi:hypothetical protein [Desulfovibrio cuneatus]|uniref:hypothetical protein n=1 Tax=Desulfovibrio cuneatus TaxID=159728 RepID=UPI00047F3301|nr:hypothetical protein [Desulfovibrio cuneatus]
MSAQGIALFIRPFILVAASCFLCVALSSAALAGATAEREVLSTGLGLTEEAARKQAFRSAVQNVIGAMVITETLVQNEELVRDKVLSHSDGYISKATQVGPARPLEGGLVEVTMRVTVKSDRLKAKLSDENISQVRFDGNVLFQAALAQMQQQQEAATSLLALRKPLPASLVRIEAHSDKASQKLAKGMVQLALPISVSIDEVAYGAMAQQLTSLLEGMGHKRVQATLALSSEGELYTQGLLQKIGGSPQQTDGNALFLLGVCELVQAEKKSSRWSFFWVPQYVLDSFRGNGRLIIQVELLDKEGKVVAVQEQHMGDDSYAAVIQTGFPATDPLRVVVAPRFNLVNKKLFLDSSFNTSPQQKQLTFSLSEQELARLVGVRSSVTNAL